MEVRAVMTAPVCICNARGEFGEYAGVGIPISAYRALRESCGAHEAPKCELIDCAKPATQVYVIGHISYRYCDAHYRAMCRRNGREVSPPPPAENTPPRLL